MVDCINYEKQMVLDVIQQRDELFKKDSELSYSGNKVKVENILKEYPVQTETKNFNRLAFKKVRYYCQKIKDE